MAKETVRWASFLSYGCGSNNNWSNRANNNTNNACFGRVCRPPNVRNKERGRAVKNRLPLAMCVSESDSRKKHAAPLRKGKWHAVKRGLVAHRGGRPRKRDKRKDGGR